MVDGAQVSLWEYVPNDGHRRIDFEQLGEVVARLHRVEPSQLTDVVALPFSGDAAWLAIERRLARAQVAGAVDAAGFAALERAALNLGNGSSERAKAHWLSPMATCIPATCSCAATKS